MDNLNETLDLIDEAMRAYVNGYAAASSAMQTPNVMLPGGGSTGQLPTAADLPTTPTDPQMQKQVEQELLTIVDNGCTVIDVVVEHPVYGQLTGQLHLSSRYDVGQFLQKVSRSGARPLSALTGGVHLHTILCPDEAAWHRVRAALDQAGFLYTGP